MAKQHPAIKAIHFDPAATVQIEFPDYETNFVPVAGYAGHRFNLPNVGQDILSPLVGLSITEFFVALGRMGANGDIKHAFRPAWEWARTLA